MFKLPDLSYSYDALEPTLGKLNMEIHHGKHHAAYVNNLNAALEGEDPALLKMDPASLLKHISVVSEAKRKAVVNNGGQHYNHSLFWECMAPGKGGKPVGDLAAAIDKNFGSFDAFKDLFGKTAVGTFGSGWAFLAYGGGKLAVSSHSNQSNPILDGSGAPILTIDVWEHAYYLTYQNRRPDFVSAFWSLVDWAAADKRFNAALKG